MLRSPLIVRAIEGLRSSPRVTPNELIYDAKGMDILRQAIHSPSYYTTDVELTLIRKHAAQIVALADDISTIVDYGGSTTDKARPLLNIIKPAHYVVVDIATSALKELQASLAHEPFLSHLHEADFSGPVTLPDVAQVGTALGLCLGLTLCNFTSKQVRECLREMRITLGDGANLLVSSDMVQKPEMVIPAYNEGYAFQALWLNVLVRLNKEAEVDFDVDKFRHQVHWNIDASRVEVFLISQCDQIVKIGDEEIQLMDGEEILIFTSYKYSLPKYQELITKKTGWKLLGSWSDADNRIALHLLSATPISKG